MSLLGGLASELMKGVLTQMETQGAPNVLSQILGNSSLGSVGGLLQQLQQGGLAGQVASWLGNGTNQPVSTDQLRNALGNEHLIQMARSAGLPVDDLLKLLEQKLPGAVDQMSPSGKLQEPTSAAADADTDDTDDSDDEAPAAKASGGGSLADQAGLGDIGRRR
jgi:uncharacterized protein YidB (DUF937 family)